MKNVRGITLIALIITIILLLILAGVVLSLTLGNNGIFKLATNASKNYINAAEDEENRLNDIQNNVDNVLKDENINKDTTLACKAGVGDYVIYDPTKGVKDSNLLTYTSPVGSGMSHGNGCSVTDDSVNLSNGQTFTANGNIKWRILSTNKESGEVVLISEEPVKTDAGRNFYMNGAIGYLYAEQELNEICKIYGYGEGADTTKEFNFEIGDVVEGVNEVKIKGSGARSINVKDINRITGYEQTEGTSYTHTIYYPTKNTEDGKSTSAASRTDINRVYIYKGSDYLSDTTSEIYKMLFRNITNSSDISYWIASRFIASYATAASFGVPHVDSGEVKSNGSICDCQSGKVSVSVNSYAVRPILYLKTNIQTAGKDENGAWIIVD